MKPNYTISKDIKVGIWDNEERVARVYIDKVIVIEPYVRWIGNNGSLAQAKKSIRNSETVAAIIRELEDNCEDTAWEIIEQKICRY